MVKLLTLLLLLFASPAWAASPTVSAASNSTDTTGTSHSVTIPACAAGDTYVGFISTDGDSGGKGWPGGWTEILDYKPGNNKDIGAAWRKSGGSDSSPITVTTVNSEATCHVVYCIAGATDPTVTPPEVSAGSNGADDNPDPASLSPTGGSKDYLFFAMAGNGTSKLMTAYPTSYTNGETYESGTASSDCAIGVARRALTATSDDPGAFTQQASNEPWAAATIAVHPGAAVEDSQSAPTLFIH